jgi:hypothetical protein
MKNLQALMKYGIMMIQKLEENGEMPLKRSLMIWISNKFGRFVKNEDIPEDGRTIKCKLILQIKQNGIFRARLVAYGYS